MAVGLSSYLLFGRQVIDGMRQRFERILHIVEPAAVVLKAACVSPLNRRTSIRDPI